FPTLAARFGISPSPAQREKGFLPNSRRKVRDQPFSCEAGEGGAQRRMRAPAQRSALAFPRQQQKHASLRPRPLIPPPGTFSREREKGFFPSLRQQRPDQPFSCEAGEGGAQRRMRAGSCSPSSSLTRANVPAYAPGLRDSRTAAA